MLPQHASRRSGVFASRGRTEHADRGGGEEFGDARCCRSSGCDRSGHNPVTGAMSDNGGPAAGHDEVEVAHEALVRHWPTLRAWLDEDREGFASMSQDIGAPDIIATDNRS